MTEEKPLLLVANQAELSGWPTLCTQLMGDHPEVTGWPDYLTHSVFDARGNRLFQVRTPSALSGYDRVVGGGGEAVVYKVAAVSGSGDLQPGPLVLKSYSASCFKAPNGELIIHDVGPRRPIQTVRDLVQRQLAGYELIEKVNQRLSAAGEPILPLPDFFGLALSPSAEPSIVMSDLRGSGEVLMLEHKLLLDDNNTDDAVDRKVRQTVPGFKYGRRKLAWLALAQARADHDRALRMGVVFEHRGSKGDEKYPQFFAPWSVLVGPGPEQVKFVLHDFHSVYPAGSGPNREAENNLARAEELWGMG